MEQNGKSFRERRGERGDSERGGGGGGGGDEEGGEGGGGGVTEKGGMREVVEMGVGGRERERVCVCMWEGMRLRER